MELPRKKQGLISKFREIGSVHRLTYSLIPAFSAVSGVFVILVLVLEQL